MEWTIKIIRRSLKGNNNFQKIYFSHTQAMKGALVNLTIKTARKFRQHHYMPTIGFKSHVR